MTDTWFFGYKFLIYKANLTKFFTNVETTAAHKPCEFQEYQLRESPLGQKSQQIVIFWFFRLEIPKYGHTGVKFDRVRYDLPNLTQNDAVVRQGWAKNQKSHFNTGTFCR